MRPAYQEAADDALSHAPHAEHAQRHLQILIIDLEPTPYKTDLWNTLANTPHVSLDVLYTERKNWAPDGGHNYQKWPQYQHTHRVMDGKGWRGRINSAYAAFLQIWRTPTDLICIAGYVHLATVTAIFAAVLRGRRFAVHADEFNVDRPSGRLWAPKWMVREGLRRLIFSRSVGVLVCGKRGISSAKTAGCPTVKIIDFPYVIDACRMQSDHPSAIPIDCQHDLEAERLVIAFSGRMIPRKGLPTLLHAIATLKTNCPWILWVEGDGPELSTYQQLAQGLGLQDKVRFLGFCQYDLHSWLIRSSDIVVVPSLEDTWGIVVDEGLQLGKATLSSDATGSGCDRIENGINGLIFPAGNVSALQSQLERLINDASLRNTLGQAAQRSTKNRTPADNIATLLHLVQR